MESKKEKKAKAKETKDEQRKSFNKQDNDLLADKLFNNHYKSIVNSKINIGNSSNQTLRQIL